MWRVPEQRSCLFSPQSAVIGNTEQRYVGGGASPGELRWRDAVRELAQTYWNDFPDLKWRRSGAGGAWSVGGDERPAGLRTNPGE